MRALDASLIRDLLALPIDRRSVGNARREVVNGARVKLLLVIVAAQEDVCLPGTSLGDLMSCSTRMAQRVLQVAREMGYISKVRVRRVGNRGSAPLAYRIDRERVRESSWRVRRAEPVVVREPVHKRSWKEERPRKTHFPQNMSRPDDCARKMVAAHPTGAGV